MTTIAESGTGPADTGKGPLVYRQPVINRITHWVWAIALFFLLLSGLQIFNAHPSLYIGQQSGFEFDNAVLKMYARAENGKARGYTEIFGHRFDTTGVFGVSGTDARPQLRGFPAAVTIPSYQDLGTGRVVHFFFGWVLVAALFVWFLVNAIKGRIRAEIVPKFDDIRDLSADIGRHSRFRFVHGRSYGALQKLTYSAVFFVLFPLIILTGLAMSPGMNASWSILLDVFGGRQTARTIHFSTMVLLVLFFVIHLLMVIAAGPVNEMRSMITGWYRTSPGTLPGKGDRP